MASDRPAPGTPRRASIRAQLALLVVAATLPLIALEAWTLYDTAKDDERQARQQVLHLAEVTASDTAKFLGQAQNILNGLAARPAVRALDPARCDPILKDFLGLAPRFANVLTFTMDSRVVCSAVPLAGFARGEPERFLNLMRGPDHMTVGRAFRGAFIGRWIMPVGRPLLDAQGGIAGAVVLPIDLARLPVLPSVEGLPAKTAVGIVSSGGIVLAFSLDPARFVGTNVRDQPGARIVLREKRGTAEDIGLDGNARIMGFTPVPGTDWIAVTSIPASEAYVLTRTRVARSTLISIAILSAALLLAMRLGRRIREPIAALACAAGEVAAGNLATRAPVAGAIEIAEVAVQFNRMLDARLHGEAELRAARDRFQKIFHAAPLASIVSTLVDTRVLEVNEAYCAMVGHARDALIGRSVLELEIWSEPGERIALIERLRLEPRVKDVEVHIRGATGEIRNVLVSAERIDFLGQDCSLQMGVDITDRKQTAQLLALEHSVMRAFADTPDSMQALRAAIGVICESGRWSSGRYYRWVADRGLLRFHAAWGIEDEGIQQHIEASRAVTYSPGMGLVGTTWQSRRTLWVPDVAIDPRVLRPGAAQVAGIRASLAVPVFAAGSPIGVLIFHSQKVRTPDARLLRTIEAIGTQIGQFVQRGDAEHAMRESEARFRIVFEQAAVGVGQVETASSRFALVNRRYAEITGYSQDEMKRLTYPEITHPDDAQADADWQARMERGEVDSYSLEKRYLRKDGTIVWVNLWASKPSKFGGESEFHTAVVEDITVRKRAELLLAGEKSLLEMVASGAPLEAILDATARSVETFSTGTFCSILLLDADGVYLRHGAAPSLPDGYNRAIDGLAIGPNVGSCGTAAYRDQRVIVTDIATDPLWDDFRALALQHQLRACWSTPIRSGNGRVLGTFALYYREPRSPAPADLELVDRLTHLTSICIVRKRAEDALRESAGRLEALGRRLLNVQESERRAIARELHDEVGGVLAAVKLNLQSLRGKAAGAAGEAALGDGLALVDGAIQSMRSLSLDLRPAVLDDLGLIPALKWYCDRQAQRAGLPIEPVLDAVDLKRVPQLESACFRIVQESVINALRHANPRRIQVALRRGDDSLVLEITDDGAGFDVAAARRLDLDGQGSGLLGMEERAALLGGRLRIDSAPGAGTRITAEFAKPEGGFE